MAGYAIIVDPFSSGRYLMDEFATRGIECIAVLSAPIPDEFKGCYVASKFADTILFDGDLDALVARLKPYAPLCVMVGLETGIALMDQLAQQLGLPGNDPATSVVRRDKYAMHAALQAHGVRAVEQILVDSSAAARDWLAQRPSWPVVVKPSNSAGSDNVAVCGSVDAALAAVEQVLSAKNLFGQRNTQALLQEYLDGREWVVDTVSCAGRHVVTNITRYLKIVTDDGNVAYRHSEFISPSDPGCRELIDYALSVNDALGVRYGAAHIEIIITERGPTLVELNARMHGCDALKALRWCYPVTQLDLSIDAYIDPAAFAAKAGQEFKTDKYLMSYFLIAEAAGTVASAVDKSALQDLKSYKSHCLPGVGKQVRKTVSLTTSPGCIWLLSDDPDALMADRSRLIEMERAGALYSLGSA